MVMTGPSCQPSTSTAYDTRRKDRQPRRSPSLRPAPALYRTVVACSGAHHNWNRISADGAVDRVAAVDTVSLATAVWARLDGSGAVDGSARHDGWEERSLVVPPTVVEVDSDGVKCEDIARNPS